MKQEKLIFLISQPRSGSTLTQKLLGAHSKIYTRSEPWAMLYPLYRMKENGYNAEYGAQTSHRGFNTFLEGLPGKKEFYNEKLRQMYLSLYGVYLTNDTEFFLDKTTRYYLILDELQKLFPDAKTIYLIRNPMAVLSSILISWPEQVKDDLSIYKTDLIDAIDIACKTISQTKKNVFILHYENLIKETEVTLKQICAHLGILFEKQMIHGYLDATEKFELGDQLGIYQKEGIDTENDEKWITELSDEKHWKLLYGYLNYIGREKFMALGYDFDQTTEIFRQHCPYDIFSDGIEEYQAFEKLLLPTSSATNAFIFENKLNCLQSEIDQKEKLIDEQKVLIENLRNGTTEKETSLVNQILKKLNIL